MSKTAYATINNGSTENIETALVKFESFITLLRQLSKQKAVTIKLKRSDRTDYGNFSSIMRFSSAIVLLMDEQVGSPEVLPDTRIVTRFRLSDNFLEYKSSVDYHLL